MYISQVDLNKVSLSQSGLQNYSRECQHVLDSIDDLLNSDLPKSIEAQTEQFADILLQTGDYLDPTFIRHFPTELIKELKRKVPEIYKKDFKRARAEAKNLNKMGKESIELSLEKMKLQVIYQMGTTDG